VDIEELVKDFIAAWNRQDVAGILELTHGGAAFYDAFWMETCVGKDLPKYLQDSIDAEGHWYQQIGELIKTQNGAAYRYSAHEKTGSTISEPIFFGAEVLVVRDNKILTLSDYYCNPDRAALEEIAELASKRHGLPSHTTSGLGALKASRVKAQLSATIAEDRSYLDPNLTLSRLAEKIGCPVDHLSQIIDKEFGIDFDTLLSVHRITYAESLFRQRSGDPNYVLRVAAEAGFKSFQNFNDVFLDTFGVTPVEYYKRIERAQDGTDNAFFH
jgi:AraC-like DNA-binding protein